MQGPHPCSPSGIRRDRMADDKDKAVPNPERKTMIVRVDGSVGFADDGLRGSVRIETNRLQSESFRAWAKEPQTYSSA